MYGGLQESHQDEVEIKDANLVTFKILLKYIYKGYISLNNEKVSFSFYITKYDCWLILEDCLQSNVIVVNTMVVHLCLKICLVKMLVTKCY